MSNPPNEREEPIFSEEFRNVFLKRGSDPKRTHLPQESATVKKKLRKNSLKRGAVPLPSVKTAKAAAVAATNKAPKYVRRFRSRSLPIISYRQTSVRKSVAPHGKNTQINCPGSSSNISSSSSSSLSLSSNTPPLLPPINLQSLKEIDLHEILKNPQLRHDILFDPQLQFRPNLDGERGRRKKNIIEGYWQEVERECYGIFILRTFNESTSRIPSLFATLKDILLSLLPYKDRQAVTDVMDMDLLIQQLSVGTFDFVALAQWLGRVFKQHCAPMRDNWVSEMVAKFIQASEENSVNKLVSGLRMVFSILEAMKLDVANHQIRILRPVLVETAVEFERDYFNQLISHHKLDIQDSLRWYRKNYKENTDEREHLVISILDLLSCRKMVSEFPSTLAFDHTRLILLRADIRQLVCIQLCVILYKQLVLNSGSSGDIRAKAMSAETVSRVQEEILSIVTDDNGTIKWTRNVNAIALQLVKNSHDGEVPQSAVEFAYGWLLKQIQPSADVYGLMEEKVFKELKRDIHEALNNPHASNIPTGTKRQQQGRIQAVNGHSFTTTPLNTSTNTSGTSSIATRIATLAKFHWNVFDQYYTDYLKRSID